VPLTAPSSHRDPARPRGLRRTRRLAPCAPVSPTPRPAAPSAVELLALLTRVRATLIATGELAPARLYDLRAFKTCWAELGYLHRLAAGGRHGGTIVTSMRQLVGGLSALHPAWKLTGDPWADRDRHHRSVRRRLSTLAAAGLLQWRIGVDEDLEERRTELALQPTPQLMPDELEAATAQLARWQARYGPALNSSSRTGITDVKHHAQPLTPAEARRRGIAHARRVAQARRVPASSSNSHPPFGASATPKNSHLEYSANHANISEACRNRTGVTRMRANSPANKLAAPERRETAALREGRPTFVDDATPGGQLLSESGWQDEVLQRVRGAQAQRAPVLVVIAKQVQRRCDEVAGWDLQRNWPSGRLREAWAAARYGPGLVADHGHATAGRLTREHYLRLRRAVARYQRNASAAPSGYPLGGLAGLLHLAALARDAEDGPRTLAYGIGALDQLSRRMRALATAESLRRGERQVRHAHTRHSAGEPAAGLAYRTAPWPSWVVLDDQGLPRLTLTEALEEILITRGIGAPSRQAEQAVLRDALLLRYGSLPPNLDGRLQMAMRIRGQLPPSRRRTGERDG